MRAYVIDEISETQMKKVVGFLKEHAIPSGMDSVFWIRVPQDLLSESQFQHHGCQPHVVALELDSSSIRIEFFVRSLTTLRCTCPGYCTAPQLQFVLNFAQGMMDQLRLQT